MDDELWKSIPPQLRMEIEPEYYFKIKELDFFLRTRERQKPRRKTLEYLIFLGVLYRRIIKPIDGTLSFSYSLMNAGANGLKVGKKQFNHEKNKQLFKTVIEFKKILEKYNIPAEILEYMAIEDFMKSIERIERKI